MPTFCGAIYGVNSYHVLGISIVAITVFVCYNDSRRVREVTLTIGGELWNL